MKKIKLFTIVLLLTGFNFIATAQENKVNNDAQEALSNVNKQFFIENKGQWDADVLYLTKIGGLDAWITKKGINYTFYQLEEVKQEESANRELEIPDKFEHKDYNIIGHRVLMNLIGNNPNVSPEGKDKQTAYYNYLIGNDDTKHASNVGLYKEALVKDVYTGIDIRYYFDRGNLRYDYIVNSGSDPRQIRFSLEGSNKTYLNEKGELVFTTRFGEVKNADLYCYQEQDKKSIDAHFTKQGESWTITLDAYNKNQTLIIDPLIYSTYIGGSDTDWGNAITLDASGNAYITGQSQSTNYDVTPGVFQTIYGGGLYDVFVTKLNTTGTALIYSTYIGGSGSDIARSIAIDASGISYITGQTGSTNYNVTAGVFQTVKGGFDDVFVTKLNASGTALLYSTYIGDTNDDRAYTIAIDASGNAYIAGLTGSMNYDITPGAFQTNYGGGNADVFVTKLNASGTALLYSTFIGGSDTDWGLYMALDASGNIYITGETRSTDYNITSGAFQTTYGGGVYDVFVTKINATGTGLLYSTYIGGSNIDYGTSMVLDATGNAYITGYTASTNYDVTTGAFQTTFAGAYDVFVTKLNASGTALLYSTYIGGSNDDRGRSITLGASSYAYITGFTKSTNYDIAPGAFQTTYGGGTDVFVTKLDLTGTTTISEIVTTNLFSVFPNPSQGVYQIVLKNTNSTDEVFVEVYNLQGKLIHNKTYSNANGINLNLSKEPNGIYTVKITDKQSSQAVKLIKQ